MRTDSQEFLDLLYQIQDNNMPSLAVLAPGYEPFYEIDLNTRTISSPDILSIKTDHKAETVYFKVARYYDGIDLSNLCCIIQYINAAGEGRIYIVPYYDLDTCSGDDMILFPWVIDGEATKAAGEVQYSVRFFLLDTSGSYLIYNLNTLPATGEVKHGIDFVYDDIYVEANPKPTAETYVKGKYYVLNSRTGHYELSEGEFDEAVQYYEKTSLGSKPNEWAASFVEQMAEYVQQMSEKDLTWIVV